MKKWFLQSLAGVCTLSGCTVQKPVLVYQEACFSQTAFNRLMKLPPEAGKPAFVIHQTESGECVAVTLCSKPRGGLSEHLQQEDIQDAIHYAGPTKFVRTVSQKEAEEQGIKDFQSASDFVKTVAGCQGSAPARITTPIPTL